VDIVEKTAHAFVLHVINVRPGSTTHVKNWQKISFVFFEQVQIVTIFANQTDWYCIGFLFSIDILKNSNICFEVLSSVRQLAAV
jgi:hypothetical protein